MGQLIKVFSDGSYIEYGRGNFDGWCVYEIRPDTGYRRPPRDIDYFQTLKNLAEKYGADRIYHDFCKVYTLTDKNLSPTVLQFITELSEEYGEDAVVVDKTFSIIYCGMIAEEQKAGTRLGKRIKRLGIHVLLMDNQTVGYAANFMRGMGWRDIDRHCQERGF